MPGELDQRSVSRRNVLGTVVSGTIAASTLSAIPTRGHADDLVVPEPTPDSPRRVALQLSDASHRAVNNLLFNVVNVQKRYGLDNVKVAVFAYADGVRALYKDSAPAPDRIRSLMEYGVEFVACGSTLEAEKRSATDVIDGVSVVAAAIPELVERHLRGWVVIHP
ncbi:DsrE family protein [Methylocapsa aurea]|uniref:DsrE family protein n=1 Tax=Methylocapsa aurea TaxID=663610 RepID=UPI000A00EE45|nr:DsrE family protein [Methylocapsa aurea]